MSFKTENLMIAHLMLFLSGLEKTNRSEEKIVFPRMNNV